MAAGEILGVAGVSGNGQYALAEALAGLAPVEVRRHLSRRRRASPNRDDEARSATTSRICRNARLDNAVVADLDLGFNLALRQLRTLPLFPRTGKTSASGPTSCSHVSTCGRRFRRFPPAALSGGNLQKLVIARELSDTHRLVIASYPTMGLDVLAAQAVYRSLFDQAAAGACVVWISEDLDDLMAYAHRIAVIYGGASPELSGGKIQSADDRSLDGRHGSRRSGVNSSVAQRSLYGVGGAALFLMLASIFLLAIGRPPLSTLATMAGYAFGDRLFDFGKSGQGNADPVLRAGRDLAGAARSHHRRGRRPALSRRTAGHIRGSELSRRTDSCFAAGDAGAGCRGRRRMERARRDFCAHGSRSTKPFRPCC